MLVLTVQGPLVADICGGWMFLNCKHLYMKNQHKCMFFDVFYKYLYAIKNYLLFLNLCLTTLLIFILLQHFSHSVNYFLQWVLLFALFRQTDENFSSLVTLDLGTIDNYNENQLRELLYTQIADYRRLGGISASEKNFNFRSFGGTYHEQWTQLPFSQYFFVYSSDFLLLKTSYSYVFHSVQYCSVILVSVVAVAMYFYTFNLHIVYSYVKVIVKWILEKHLMWLELER